ncbi:MAG: AsnC family transcriptional regulator [Deltaproteobacteria bacterium]|nr:AsnC family transcriptional regulator [Deltaproteobacteria bacterium]
MDTLDRKILNRLQADIPFVARPFAEIATALDSSEDEVLRRVERLKKEERVIRQISAIFDTRSLGYASSLVAAAVPAASVQHAAQVLNGHPGVSHNYERDNRFNIWFTIAVPPESSLEKTVARLGELARVETIRTLQTLRLFKIAVKLDVAEERAITAKDDDESPYSDEKRSAPRQLTADDRVFIREMQRDIDLVAQPFDRVADALGVSLSALFGKAESLQKEGVMRRFAAILRHQKAGFVANGMGVWKVRGAQIAEVGAKFAAYQAVSHCYERPVYADWPYAVFSMIHGKSEAAVREIAATMSKETGVSEYDILFSTREFKKTRVQYFTDDTPNWEARFMNGP